MKKLEEYQVIKEEVFYKCWHILEYIDKHQSLTELDKLTISNTIMDALVERKLIDPETELLDLENLCITNHGFKYQQHPDVTGIPLWLKEKMRMKSLMITGGIPISIFMAKPPGNVSFCLYDPCTALSSLFEEVNFIEAKYDSPTREGIRLESTRPFIEVEINGELYLIDVLLKRMYRSTYFKEKYNIEITNYQSKTKMNKDKKKSYKEAIKEENQLSDGLFTMNFILSSGLNTGSMAEMSYELEKTKEIYPDAWEEYKKIMEDFDKWSQSNEAIKLRLN